MMVGKELISTMPEPSHLATPFLDRLEAFGKEPVIHSEDFSWTTQQLAALVDRVECWLESQGCKGNASTLIWEAGNHPLLAAVYLASVAKGYRLALINPDWPESVRQTVVSQLQPECRISAATVDTIVDAISAEISPEISTEIPVAISEDTRMPSKTVDAQGRNQRLDQHFLVVYTSGTTGVPRALVRTQRSWLNSFVRAEAAFGLTSTDHILIPGPLHYSLSFFALANGLYTGAQMTVLTHFSVQQMVVALNCSSIDVMILAPTLLLKLIAAITSGKQVLRHADRLRLIVCAGDKLQITLRNDVSRLFPKARLMEYYGASEFSFVAVNDGSAPAQSVGRLFPGVAVCTRDADGSLLPPGEPGFLCVDSDMLACGYLDGQGKVTAMTTLSSTSMDVKDNDNDNRPTLHVGDIGYVDEHSHLYLLGRLDDRINTGGVKVYPVAIENVLQAMDGVKEVLVAGVPDPTWGQCVVAVVSIDDDQANSDQSLQSQMQQRCREQLGESSVPRHFIYLSNFETDLPSSVLLASGKYSRQDLAVWLAQQVEMSA